jgi:competence protein ComEC
VAIIVALLGFLYSQGYLDSLLNQQEPPAPVDGQVEFHFIDVGQGDAALIRTPEGNILIDAGTNDAEDELVAYLKAEGITELAYAVFTHPHEDHIGGADAVLDYCEVKNVILPEVTATTVVYNRMMDAIETEGATVIIAVPEATYTVGDLKMTILGPIGSNYKDMNNDSSVLRADFGESSVLYTGDAEDVSEKEMLEAYRFGGKLDCELLKVGHHGSENSSTEAFMDAVTPEMAVISCGEGNKYGHPTAEALSRLDARKVTYWRTDLLGSIVIISNGETLTKE